jgi:hypothetical protein
MVAGMYQPRTRMDEGALYELAESIKAQGIMQPILVRQLTEGGPTPEQRRAHYAYADSAEHREGLAAFLEKRPARFAP